ncbi:MAG: YkgJ family cysteine cluster protein [Lachnospiraceae bacterium]|nr:YkgJ family cysteine cluster protein [Lachnospiraceae bacterium]
MEREIDLQEISDGKLYTANDMVKIGCNDCKGCSECCRVVGDTIILDPYDLWQLESGLQTDFETLMQGKIELQVVDGTILPNLKIREGGAGCSFLSAEGRCTIHGYRPGFCRMFPMGRIYEDGGFKYFLQVHECDYPNKTKVKLKKWMGIPELARYEKFVLDWHDFLKEVQAVLKKTENQEIVKNLNLYILNQFFVTAYEADDFYGQFYGRMEKAEEMLRMYR